MLRQCGAARYGNYGPPPSRLRVTVGQHGKEAVSREHGSQWLRMQSSLSAPHWERRPRTSRRPNREPHPAPTSALSVLR